MTALLPRPRRRVDELLDAEARRRVCLVIGGAGWGKTTAVSSWASGTRVAWVRCDCDEQPLLDHLCQALEPHVAARVPAGHPTTAAERTGSGAGELCGWLRGNLFEDLVVVIDDLHHLHPDSDSARLVEGMCRRAPDGLHLVLISRQEPPFSVQRLRGRGLVSEISAPDLALDVAEISAWLDRTIGEAPADLSWHLRERTSGWPAAVDSAVELLRGTEPDQRLGVLEQLSRPGERLHGYLAEEVVGREPEPVRELLRRLAVCEEVGSTSGVDEHASVLVDLTRRGLVRRGRGDSPRWTLVQPLRDYFAQETALSSGDRTALHRAAGQECLARDDLGGALRHLVAAGEHDECVALLRAHGRALVRSGQVAAVLSAARLPARYLGDCWIQQILGQARQIAGQPAEARECFRLAGRDNDVLEPALAWQLAQIAFTQGEFDEVRAVYRRTRFAAEDGVDETRLLVLVAMTCRLIGDLVGSRSATNHAVAAARRCGDPGAWAAVHCVLALQTSAAGDRGRSDGHWADALHNATAGNDQLQVAFIGVAQAARLLDFGLPRRALAEAGTALAVSEECQSLFLIGHARTVQGRANARLGVLDRAVADLTKAVEVFQRLGSRFLSWPLCGLADVHRTRGQLARARAAYEEALALAEPCGDVLALGSTLTGLARVRAADDLDVARGLAERAVALADGLGDVPAMLTRGWVALQAGDRQAALSDAERAGSVAGMRRDDPGLAEALLLKGLTVDRSAPDPALFGEAIDIWREAGCLVDESVARVVADRVGAQVAELGADLARQTLLDHGVDVRGRAAGPLGSMALLAPSVRIRTLGGFQVIRDGVPVPRTVWQSKKARDLLKLLVARRRPVPREQLMELLWPGTDIARSGNRLSVLLSMARDVLAPRRDGDGPLATDGNAVWLDRQLVTIDVEEFLTEARLALDAHRRGAREATARLIRAEAGYAGGFLVDDPYQDWAQSLAEEVRATHVALLRSLGCRLRRAGDVDGVVRYLLRLLEHDGYDEQAHLDLVSAQLEAGRLGEARRRYRIYVQRMKEMRVDPHPLPAARRWSVGGHMNRSVSQL